MAYLIPTAILAAVSLFVLLFFKRSFPTPQAHFLGHPGEIAILASNVSGAFTVTTFWSLFIFSVKCWSVPSFMALQAGIAGAYLFYVVLLYRETTSNTFLNLIFGDNAPVVVRRIFFGLALLSIVVELGLGRALVEAILIRHNQPAWIATVSIAALGLLTILYTFNGGMFAVILTDAIFILLCLIALLVLGLTLQMVPDMIGMREDLAMYDFSRLSGLDVVFYFSAFTYVFLMFFFHPDFWYRNLRLPYVSKGRRLTTILLSALFTSALLQIAYFIGASSRTPTDWALLYNNLTTKQYDVGSVLDVLAKLFNSEASTVALVFLILVSAFTTVSSLIISAVAGYYETDSESGSDRYKDLLFQFFRLTVIITIVSLTFDIATGIFAALLIASAELTLTSSILGARGFRLRSQDYLPAIVLSLLLFGAFAAINVLAARHYYYPFLALVASAMAALGLWIATRLRGASS